jgi:hypothetical protein
MLKGIHLTLFVGPAVPAPVGRSVLEALSSVQVTSAAGQRSGFQLTFTLATHSPLHTIFLLAAGSTPQIRVILVATVNGTPQVLIDGVMTQHEVSPGADPGQATLTVTGEDLSAVMDFVDMTGLPYPGIPIEARVALIVSKYAVYGIIPLVVPSVLVDVPVPTERIPRHQGTDLAYIRHLAAEVGYVFYHDPGPAPGTSVAYWGPEIKVGVPQPALSIDMDAHTNVESISFRFDAEGRELPVAWVQEPLTKIPLPIPIPEISLLNPPLGAIPPIPKRIRPVSGLAKRTPLQAALCGLASASRSADVVTATGTLDVLRYGRILKARGLVGVRGAGTAYDGLYFVKSVTHSIKRGEYKQNFTLTRNGLVSTLPRVPV